MSPQATPTQQRPRQIEDTATRHLCVGAYFDRRFRDMIIRKVHNDASHRVAPCYSFDIVPLVLHAWRSWVLDIAQQLLILLLLILALVRDFPAAVMAICAIGVWYLLRIAGRAAPEMLKLHSRAAAARWLRRRSRTGESERLRERSRLVVVTCTGCLLLIVLAVTVAAASHAGLEHVAIHSAVLLLIIAGISALAGAVRQLILNRIQGARSLRPERLTTRLRTIESQQDCDYVVYRRAAGDEPSAGGPASEEGYQPPPFVGAGTLVHRWLPPLGIQLLRPGEGRMADREHIAPPFKAHELVEHLQKAMAPLGHTSDPNRLRGFQIRDRLYIAEADVAPERAFLQGRQTAGEIRSVIDDPHGAVQHYLEMRVSQAGELVTTVFLRVTVRGRSLSLDFAACALTRTPTSYHILDGFGETGTAAVLRSAWNNVYDIPATLGRLWQLVEVPWMLTAAAWARKDRTMIPRRGATIGTRISLREESATPWADADQDRITIYDEMKIIEQRLLKAAEDFLETRNVDTSVFKRRILSIINMGVLNMGKMEMNQTAVGPEAQFQYNTGGAPDGGGADQMPQEGGT